MCKNISTLNAETQSMQRDAFIVAIIVLLIGIILIPISQMTNTEIRERLGEKQTIQIPNGGSSFTANLGSSAKYQLFIKGGLIAPFDPVKINVSTPDNSSFLIEFPIEEPKTDFQTTESSGFYNFTFESAYAGSNTRAEISGFVPYEAIMRPFASFFYVGIAFVIVGSVFVVIGMKYPRKQASMQ